MKFEKVLTVKALREAVWRFLWDVPRMAACIPGCKEAKVVEEGKRYAATVTERAGPFNRLLKKAHLRRWRARAALRRTVQVRLAPRIAGRLASGPF